MLYTVPLTLQQATADPLLLDELTTKYNWKYKHQVESESRKKRIKGGIKYYQILKNMYYESA